MNTRRQWIEELAFAASTAVVMTAATAAIAVWRIDPPDPLWAWLRAWPAMWGTAVPLSLIVLPTLRRAAAAAFAALWAAVDRRRTDADLPSRPPPVVVHVDRIGRPGGSTS